MLATKLALKIYDMTDINISLKEFKLLLSIAFSAESLIERINAVPTETSTEKSLRSLHKERTEELTKEYRKLFMNDGAECNEEIEPATRWNASNSKKDIEVAKI